MHWTQYSSRNGSSSNGMGCRVDLVHETFFSICDLFSPPDIWNTQFPIIYHIWTFSIQIQQRSFILFIHHPFPTFNPHSHGLGHFRQRFLSCRLKKIYPSHYRIKFSRDAWEKIKQGEGQGQRTDENRSLYLLCLLVHRFEEFNISREFDHKQLMKVRYTNGKIKFRYQIKKPMLKYSKVCNLPKCTKFEFASHHKINRVLVCKLSLSGTFLQI